MVAQLVANWKCVNFTFLGIVSSIKVANVRSCILAELTTVMEIAI
jgi:hypothetical protein